MEEEIKKPVLTNVFSFPKKVGFKGPPKPSTTDENQGMTLTADAFIGDDAESRRRSIINHLCEVYSNEIFFKLASMGYDVFSPAFEKDMEFTQEALHSALLRTYQVYHPIQDFVDENFELISVEDFNQMTANSA